MMTFKKLLAAAAPLVGHGCCIIGEQSVTQYTLPHYKRRAIAGDAEAQYRFGFCYYHGQVIGRNFAEAVRWYRKAAAQGFPMACQRLQAIEAVVKPAGK